MYSLGQNFTGSSSSSSPPLIRTKGEARPRPQLMPKPHHLVDKFLRKRIHRAKPPRPVPPLPPPFEEEEAEKDYDNEKPMDEEEADLSEMCDYRRGWKRCLGPFFGLFQDNTSLLPMRYTEGTIPRDARTEDVLEIFSVQVTETKDGLEWPLHVYGHIAIRDTIDQNHNLLFNRERDNCQILTQQDSYLLLTGPSRSVMIIDPVTFEVDLKVKGKTEFEDKVLCLRVFKKRSDDALRICCHCSSKRSTLEFRFAVLNRTVEATVDSVRVIEGSWPDHLRGQVLSCTAGKGEDIVLLDSRDGRMPVTCDGKIKLSRDVVCVELRGELTVRMVALQVGNESYVVAEDKSVFVGFV